jgi:3-isopropylmalate dehydrogenase
MQMLLASLGEMKAADRVHAGIGHATQRMKSMRAGEMGYTTSEVGDLVVEGATS